MKNKDLIMHKVSLNTYIVIFDKRIIKTIIKSIINYKLKLNFIYRTISEALV